MRLDKRSGFTLAELLVVVVIIGILAAIAVPKFSSSKEKAYIASMKTDLRNLASVEEAFFADSARYSDDAAVLRFRPSTGVSVPTITVGAGFWSAEVTHTLISGRTCGIAINTTNTVVASASDGEPACK